MLNQVAIPIVINCIFWDNLDNSPGSTGDSIMGPAGVNYSVVQGGWTGAGGVGNLDSDPKFVDPDGLDNNAGTRDDNLRLRSGSPAIDAGDNTVVTVLIDLDGGPRLVDDAITQDTGNGTPPVVDMGAYELQHPTIPTLSNGGAVAVILGLLGAGAAIIRRRRAVRCYLAPRTNCVEVGEDRKSWKLSLRSQCPVRLPGRRFRLGRRFASTSMAEPRRQTKPRSLRRTSIQTRLWPHGTTGGLAVSSFGWE